MGLKIPTLNPVVGPPGSQPPLLGVVQKSSSLITRHLFQLYASEAFSGSVDEDQVSLRNVFWSPDL